MQQTIVKVLEAMRTQASPEEAWAAVLLICRADEPDGAWDTLPRPDLSHDVESAANWLSGELRRLPSVNGIYLGLDTSNELKLSDRGWPRKT